MCGIYGNFNVLDAALVTREGLGFLQHRAKEYAGMVTSDGDNFYREAGQGLTMSVLTDEVISKLHGRNALGHLRYSTVMDAPDKDNTQPIQGIFRGEPFALAHNGTLTNTPELRGQIGKHMRLATSMDSELIVRLFESSSGHDLIDCVREALSHVRGSYALGILFNDRLLAVRAPNGNRPLFVGQYNDGFCIASEESAILDLNGQILYEVCPGKIIEITKRGVVQHDFGPRDQQRAHCVFEHIYYGHPASTLFGHAVTKFRDELGKRLARTCPAPGDIVVPVPDSANQIGVGYAHESRIPLELALIRSHYVGRTFIENGDARRVKGVMRKFRPVSYLIKGRSVIVVDDSIMRGTTMRKIVGLLRRSGAREVHIRIGSPQNRFSCKYGIDTPTDTELIASGDMSDESIREFCVADSLMFLPIEELRAITKKPDDYCFACMTGDRPASLH